MFVCLFIDEVDMAQEHCKLSSEVLKEDWNYQSIHKQINKRNVIVVVIFCLRVSQMVKLWQR